MAIARILPPTSENLLTAGAHLREGGLVAMPTETVYGLAGSVFSPEALARIFSVKERPTFDPLIVHVSSRVLEGDPVAALETAGLIEASSLPTELRAAAERLMRCFWPGPLTLVLPRGARVPDLVTSGLGTVGIRVPRHAVAQALLEAAETPLAAPSANRFGRISPTTPAHVLAELGDRIELIIDGGSCDVGVESTVLSLAAGETPLLLRPGAISRAELERALAAPIAIAAGPYAETKARAQHSPGMLASHYAPRTRLCLLPRALAEFTDAELSRLVNGLNSRAGAIALLMVRGSADAAMRRLAAVTGRDVTATSLAPDARAETAARNLFRCLRELDASGSALILAEPCPSNDGLWHAIADRLGRAAAPSTS